MEEKDFQKFKDAIIAIFSPEGEKLNFDIVEIKKYCSKYSSTHKLKPSIFIDGKFVSVRRGWKIQYRCSCGAINTICGSKFLMKKSLSCNKCANTEERNKQHGKILREIHQGLRQAQRTKLYISHIKYDFNSESDEFKQRYYQSHLTIAEFNLIRRYIYSINNIVVEIESVVIFLPHEPCFNHKKYRSMVNINGQIISFQNIKLKCPLCGEIFSISRPLKERFNKHNFDCKKCYFNNQIFNVKKYDDNLTYQSNLELMFIEKCLNNNIKVINGGAIPYTFNGKDLKYYIDFYLPEYSYQIELKDMHIWHRNQVKSKKWLAKQNAAERYCEENNMKYFLLYPQDIEIFFKNL